jgi:hypothetical protein
MLISTTWITTAARLVWTRASWFDVICVEEEKAEVNVVAPKHVGYLPSILWSVRWALIEQSTNQEFSVHFIFIVDLRAWFTGLGQPKMTSRGKVAHRLVLDGKLPNRICNIDRNKTWYHWFITANSAFLQSHLCVEDRLSYITWPLFKAMWRSALKKEIGNELVTVSLTGHLRVENKKQSLSTVTVWNFQEYERVMFCLAAHWWNEIWIN